MFLFTNNMTKYEALLASFQLARKIRVQKVKVFTDSQLVVRQVIGEYEVKDHLLKNYNELVKGLWGSFSKVQLAQIPKEKNTKANELARLDPFDPKATTRIMIELLYQPSIVEEPIVMAINAPN